MSANEVEVKARRMGWVPKEQFHGDPTRFVEAEAFIKRGEDILPILKKNNEGLERSIAARDTKIAELEAQVAEVAKVTAQVKQDRADAAREKIKEDLVKAKEEGNHAAEVELTDKLTRTPAEPEVAKPNGAAPPNPALEENRRVFGEFQTANDWYNKDLIKTGIANGMAQQLRAEGSVLVGRPFLDEMARRTEAYLTEREAGTRRAAPSKVEGDTRSGAAPAGGQGTGTTYGDLPPEARAACEKSLSRGDIKVGPNAPLFKSPEAYRAYYANIYFTKENA